MSSSSPFQPADPERLALVQGLFVQHMPELRGLVLAILPDFAHVDDIMQETFLTVTRKASDFEPGTNFVAWAVTIARFHVLSFRRKEGRKAHWLSEEAIEALSVTLPETESGSDGQMAALEGCIARLAPQAKRAIELRYKHGHKSGEVARLMGWTAEALYVALARARTALRQCVERKLNEEPA